MRHDGVAVLAKGAAIACARRLVLTHSEGSESASKSETVHLNDFDRRIRHDQWVSGVAADGWVDWVASPLGVLPQGVLP
ncbi:MAG: hypothetical protein B7X28_01030 [Halothiobacillus sp. 13-55-253]|jgi:hypothetical protein|nr:MAG: hypothetical protein B7X28_01030 [Halothiobacillus sp. 13-55-253]